MPLTHRVAAEFIGTLWLVLGGCGSAVLAGTFPQYGIGFAGVLARLRIDGADDGLRDRPRLGLPPEPSGLARPGHRRTLSQRRSAYVHARFAANGYGEHSPGGYSLGAALLCEFVMTSCSW